MPCFHYHDGELYIEKISLKKVAEKYGTPCYVYSRATLESNWRNVNTAFNAIPHRICYAVKANSNLAILQLFAKLNSGFDIVSRGELERVIAAGGDPHKIVFSGVGKTQYEIESAIRANIYCFDVESEPELARLASIAKQLATPINIALRINPNINPRTHSYISTGLNENKFGIALQDVIPLAQQLSSGSALRLIGLASHIGSQITELQPLLLAVDKLLEIYHQLKELSIHLQHINIGGGLGINYKNEQPPTILDYAQALQQKLAGYPLEIIIEPGRYLVGNAGVLLTRVEYLKPAHPINFAIVDAGMNDLLRPALYEAWQDILPVVKRSIPAKRYNIAGPVCESADFLGKDRQLAIEMGDLLVVDGAGAYGFSMSSNYNSRCRAAEILIDGEDMHVIRRRETINELFAAENLLDVVRN